MGIEPTDRDFRRNPTGFEDQARHQTRSASPESITPAHAHIPRRCGATFNPSQQPTELPALLFLRFFTSPLVELLWIFSYRTIFHPPTPIIHTPKLPIYRYTYESKAACSTIPQSYYYFSYFSRKYSFRFLRKQLEAVAGWRAAGTRSLPEKTLPRRRGPPELL